MKRIFLLLSLFFPLMLAAQITLSIPEIQGSSNKSPYLGQSVRTSGVVTAKFIGNGTINGYFVQDKTGDGNANTPDAIFVYSANNSLALPGDEISFTALVGEYNGRTQLSSVSNLSKLSSNNVIEPVKIDYNLNSWNWRPYMGMLVEFEQTLHVNNNANLERYGELELGVKRRRTATNVAFPASNEYYDILNEDRHLAIYIDDGITSSYHTPIVFADEHGTRRTGEKVDNLRAVVDYANNKYTLYPVEIPEFYGNSRSRTHDDIGDYNLKVCAFNLEYYLTSPNSSSMGPSSQEQVNRQHEKIIDALLAIDADVYGLSEVEQGQAALAKLVRTLNDLGGGRRYDYVRDGSNVNGTYTKVGYIYRSDKVSPYKSLREINNPTPLNRKKIQAFTLNSNNERFMLSINHFKAKSGCQNANGDDRDQGDGQSCYNGTRVREAQAVISSAATAQSYYEDSDVLVMGDLNAHPKEDPIQVFINAGYINLLEQFLGEDNYSYVYRTQAGTLDHALANENLAKQVTGATVYHINADELEIFGYDGSSYIPSLFRSSDHDPVIVGLALGKNVNTDLLEFHERVSIYPTIVTDKLHIDRAEEGIMQIFSINGILLVEEKLSTDTYSADPRRLGLRPGSYLVRVLGENRIARQMIVVR